MTALRFIGINPSTPDDGSPTVWVDDDSGDIIIQGYKIDDEETMTQIRSTGTVPGHETVLRMPRQMATILAEACQ